MLGRRVIAHVDLGAHRGVHPRRGALDVVPIVPLGSATIEDAGQVRDHVAEDLADEFDLPCFLYGPDIGPTGRSLPEIRRNGFDTVPPDFGPVSPHPTAGAVAVGARRPLVAWNIWVSGLGLDTTRGIAVSARTAGVRTLGLQVGASTQVSCNLLDPTVETPAMVLDRCRPQIEQAGGTVTRTELVGLAPHACLDAIEASRLDELDLSFERTIEAACASLGLEIV